MTITQPQVRISRREVLQTGAALMATIMGGGALFGAGVTTARASKVSTVITWNTACIQVLGATRFGSTIAGRMLAILHTCIYDAWAAYDDKAVGTRLGNKLRRPPAERTLANKNRAISYAAYRALVDLFPAQSSSFTVLMTQLGYDPNDQSTDATTPTGIGNVAAAAVLAYRHQDGANQLGDLHPGPYTDYTGYEAVNTPDHINNPNRWQPLRVSDGHGGFVVQKYATPFWGLVKPFALTSGSQFRSGTGPATYPSPEYLHQAQHILQLSAELTDEHKIIAEYWADDPGSELTPGHWCLFAQFVSQRDHHDLDRDVKLFFILTNALLDAAIVAWDTKRVYDSVRPITAIHYLFANKKVRAWGGPYQGTQLINGQDWLPYQVKTVVTPPHPEFFSSHSIVSATAATILRLFTGSDHFGASYLQPAKTSRIEPGMTPATDITLSWATYSAAAQQAGLSRHYGGIHFEQGDFSGRVRGPLIAKQAWNKAQRYIDGSAPAEQR